MPNYYLIDSNNQIQNVIFFDGSAGDYKPDVGFKLVQVDDHTQQNTVLSANAVQSKSIGKGVINTPSNNTPAQVYNIGDTFEG
jgi:hypothetical protein